MRKSGRDLDFVLAAMHLCTRLGLRTLGLSLQARETAAKLCVKGLSGYDATYLGLAEQLQTQWLTADTQAAKRAPQASVLLLKSLF